MFHTIACASGASAVIAGAFGAHALKSRLNPRQQANWETASQYQLIHSVVLLYAASLPTPLIPTPLVPASLFTAGIAMFSGSIYGLCLLPEGHPARKILGPVTPLGGLAWIAGWVMLGVTHGRLRL